MAERKYGLADTLKDIVSHLRSEVTRDEVKLAGTMAYIGFRVGLGIFLHPVASFKAHMLIGDQETIYRNLDRALSLPKFPIGRQRFQN